MRIQIRCPATVMTPLLACCSLQASPDCTGGSHDLWLRGRLPRVRAFGSQGFCPRALVVSSVKLLTGSLELMMIEATPVLLLGPWTHVSFLLERAP